MYFSMAAFDPYHKWLGIPPQEQPPHFYRLLGIPLFEADRDVIANAVEQRVQHLKTRTLGEHGALTQPMLAEVARARLTLLNPEKKSQYDESLREKVSVADSAPEDDEGDPDPPEPGLLPVVVVTDPGDRTKRRRKPPIVAYLSAVCCVVLAVLLVLVFTWNPKPDANLVEHSETLPEEPSIPETEPRQSEPAGQDVDTPAPRPRPNPVPRFTNPQPDDQPANEPPMIELPALPTIEPEEPQEPGEPGPGETTDQADMPGRNATAEGDEPGTNDPVVDKPSPPDATLIESAERLVMEVFQSELDAARKSSEKAELAKTLLQHARTTGDDPNVRYVLLDKSAHLAAEAGDLETATEALDELAASFEMDVLPVWLDCLKRTVKAVPLSEKRSVADKSLSMMDAAIQQDNFDLAKAFGNLALETGRGVRDLELIRTSVSRIKEVGVIEDQYTSIAAALATLESDPGDPEANLAVGKYQCFTKGNWQRGMGLLAQGSDLVLKNLAGEELAKPSDHSRQLALGDRWWELAESSEFSQEQKTRIQERAALWYARALPALAGVDKAKAQARLGQVQPTDINEEKEVKWQPLFNGVNLDGWALANPQRGQSWSVENQELVLNPAVPNGGSLRTTATFHDFEFRCEFALASGGDTGIYLRGLYEIQLLDDVDPVVNTRSCGSVWDQIAPTKNAYLGPGRWNTLQIKLEGKRLTVIMNGETVINEQTLSKPTGGGLTVPDGEPGPILLQHLPQHKSAVKFRNIAISVLD